MINLPYTSGASMPIKPSIRKISPRWLISCYWTQWTRTPCLERPAGNGGSIQAGYEDVDAFRCLVATEHRVANRIAITKPKPLPTKQVSLWIDPEAHLLLYLSGRRQMEELLRLHRGSPDGLFSPATLSSMRRSTSDMGC